MKMLSISSVCLTVLSFVLSVNICNAQDIGNQNQELGLVRNQEIGLTHKQRIGTTEKPELGLFGKILGIDVKLGFTAGYSWSSTGEYVYVLQQNATVNEEVENKSGSALSMVILLPVEKSGTYNLLLNIPFKELKGVSSDKDNGFFNSQTPFGLGASIYPFEGAKFLGFSAIVNFGRANRLRPENTNSNPDNKTFFVISDHKEYKDLVVGAPVPEGLLNPYYKKVNTQSFMIGVTIRF